MLSASLLLSKYAIGFVAVATTPAVAPQRAVSVSMQLPSDDELFASLRARVSVADSKTAMPPPLGPDEVGADCMGPTDVIEYCMKSLRAQAADGCSTDGCRAFLAFAVRMTDKAEDFVGQLQPGFFTGAHAFAPFYFMHSSTLTSLLPSLSTTCAQTRRRSPTTWQPSRATARSRSSTSTNAWARPTSRT